VRFPNPPSRPVGPHRQRSRPRTLRSPSRPAKSSSHETRRRSPSTSTGALDDPPFVREVGPVLAQVQRGVVAVADAEGQDPPVGLVRPGQGRSFTEAGSLLADGRPPSLRYRRVPPFTRVAVPSRMGGHHQRSRRPDGVEQRQDDGMGTAGHPTQTRQRGVHDQCGSLGHTQLTEVPSDPRPRVGATVDDAAVLGHDRSTACATPWTDRGPAGVGNRPAVDLPVRRRSARRSHPPRSRAGSDRRR
jgi:hypothetical protein